MALIDKIIVIQNKQFKLDTAKHEMRKYGKIVRSLSQEIPSLIRDLDLK